MKTITTIAAFIVLGSAFTSCKKNYTCTCTTVISGVSSTTTYNLGSQTHSDAQNSCNNYQQNSAMPNNTTCHL